MTAPVMARTGRLVMVSSYSPRRCGLATFTCDLRAALSIAAPGWRVDVAALDRGGLRYGPEVLTTIRHDDVADYRRAATLIDAAGTDLVVIQHEYGIFGGPDGRHVLALAAELYHRGVPYVVTLHTVVSSPTDGQEAVLRQLCATATAVTVFTPGARTVLTARGVAARVPVGVVPHGAPVVLRERGRSIPPTSRVRPVLPGTGGADPVLSTFGLIGPGKGLEQVIAALPTIVARHPRARYVIAGATHPEVLRTAGEAYRDGLVTFAGRLGVAEHVQFLDAYLSDAELAELLAHTTIYLTPYRGVEQACSGTLAFALVAGCPVVSTPYRHAQELLVPHRGTAPGVLVPPDDPAALALAITGLLDDPARLSAVRDAAHSLGGELTWPSAAARFADLYTAAVPALGQTRSGYLHRLDHLDRLVDRTGIIQFACGTSPDPASGYCVDDMARLALVASGLAAAPEDDLPPHPNGWLAASLRFLDSAVGEEGMYNLLDADGRWLDRPHLGDHVGRAVWAAGVVAGSGPDGGHRVRAAHLLRRMLPLVDRLTSLRSLAYAILGLAGANAVHEVGEVLRAAAYRLENTRHTRADWDWFEPHLTYDNPRLPHALLVAGSRLGDMRLVERGLSTLDWYLEQVGLGGPAPEMLRCVDNRWRGTHLPTVTGDGDEQPLDAAATVEALAAAWLATGDERYATRARLALSWFHGLNRAGVAVVDLATGACHDGLTATRVNVHQGAESTLAYHQALLAMRDAGLVECAVMAPAHTTTANPRRWIPPRRVRSPHAPRSAPWRRRAGRTSSSHGGMNTG